MLNQKAVAVCQVNDSLVGAVLWMIGDDDSDDGDSDDGGDGGEIHEKKGGKKQIQMMDIDE